jgi:hypothetical protein
VAARGCPCRISPQRQVAVGLGAHLIADTADSLELGRPVPRDVSLDRQSAGVKASFRLREASYIESELQHFLPPFVIEAQRFDGPQRQARINPDGLASSNI